MAAEPERGRVICATAGFFDVASGGEVVRCKLRGRLKKREKKTDLCVIGDQVEFTRQDDEEQGAFAATIERVLPRERVFSRRHPGKGGRHREDVLVANLDRLVAVFAFAGDPPFHERLLDRFLAIAEHNGIEALVVGNKVDQHGAGDVDPFAPYEAIGYPVVRTSAETGVGIEALREALRGRVSALVGPSGAGKSSLMNALDPALQQRVAATSDAHGKGRHTTRVATLHPLTTEGETDEGTWLADTPGIRELGTWNLPVDDLDACFLEFQPFLGDCGFRNCVHLEEPRCAIKAAVEEGGISALRYDSYVRMIRDEER